MNNEQDTVCLQKKKMTRLSSLLNFGLVSCSLSAGGPMTDCADDKMFELRFSSPVLSFDACLLTCMNLRTCHRFFHARSSVSSSRRNSNMTIKFSTGRLLPIVLHIGSCIYKRRYGSCMPTKLCLFVTPTRQHRVR